MNNVPPVPAPWLPDERTETIRVNGLNILCRIWGARHAPPIVLLHGLRGFSGTWRDLAATLSSDYLLIAPDQRGRGDSDWDPKCNYYTDAYLADLEGLVAHFALERFALLGHSMGGTTAYVYADRHPEKLAALVIEDIAPGSSAVGAGAERIIAEMTALPSGFSSWGAAREYWRARRPTVSADALEQRVAESLRQSADGCISWRYDAQGIVRTRLNPDPARSVDLWPVVERLSVPTLILKGANSDFCPADTVAEMCRRNPRLETIEISRAGHYIHDDNPTDFNASVTDFLTRQKMLDAP
ncbi:MAG: alpha/beta hydrolase [Pseudomonadota bacterium]